MEENRITVDKALEITVEILRGIAVPVGYMDTIAVPIRNAVQNIEECIAVMRSGEKPEPDGAENGEE